MYAIEEKGKIKFYGNIPDVYNNDIAFGLRTPEEHKAAGFLLVVQPILTDTQKLGEVYKDEVNQVYTYRIVEKSLSELDNEKEQKYQAEKEKIKQEKINKMAEDAINANPIASPSYYPEWVLKTGGYQITSLGYPVIVQYKSKLFKNTISGNINAPDKGGWTELK